MAQNIGFLMGCQGLGHMASPLLKLTQGKILKPSKLGDRQFLGFSNINELNADIAFSDALSKGLNANF